MSYDVIPIFIDGVSVSSLFELKETLQQSSNINIQYNGVDISSFFKANSNPSTTASVATGIFTDNSIIQNKLVSTNKTNVFKNGDYTVITYNTDGTFVAYEDMNVNLLMVAGGGGGGLSDRTGGGGGAGGIIMGDMTTLSQIKIKKGAYYVKIGNGGNGTGTKGAWGGNGGNTIAFGLTAIGGGGGGGGEAAGSNGGSGGGSAHNWGGGGIGTSGQGYNGFGGTNSYPLCAGGGGGGGAGNGAITYSGMGWVLNPSTTRSAAYGYLTGYSNLCGFDSVNSTFAEGGGPGKQYLTGVSEGTFWNDRGRPPAGNSGGLGAFFSYISGGGYRDVGSSSGVANRGGGGGGGCTNQDGAPYPSASGGSGICIITYAPASNYIMLNPIVYTLTGNTTTIVNYTGDYAFRNGTYIASASSEVTDDYLAYIAFRNFSLNNMWHSAYTGYKSYTSYPYNEGNPISTYVGGGTGKYYTTIVDGFNWYGEWLQIQFPFQSILTSYTLHALIDSAGTYSNWKTRGLQKFVVAGSNDGTTWNSVHEVSLSSNIDYKVKAEFFIPNNKTKYYYYRIVINQIFNSSVAMIARWYLYGYV